MTLEECKQKLDMCYGKQSSILHSIEVAQKEIGRYKDLHESLTIARWVFSEVSQLTQDRFKKHVESLVTMAIRAVFDRPFTFELVFEWKRNKMECRPIIMENGNEFDPENDMGGGIVDIIAFALRIVLWSLESPRSRNIIILDEPFRFVGDYAALAGKMLKEVSHMLGIQFLMITHEEELAEIADKAYKVVHNGQYSELISYSTSKCVVEKKHKLRRKTNE